jgi:hypothetical protein
MSLVPQIRPLAGFGNSGDGTLGIPAEEGQP